ncbi:MAG: hypothetical protein HQL64_05935 [Magnetococcales bacterium]|nr:hypothetical protein [Magnetococcales bacterium]
MDLSIFRTYNARIEGGVVKRGERIDDWEQYGLYYGDPRYLEIHDFSSWSLVVLDRSVLDTFDRSDIQTLVLIYIPWGSDFRKAAVQGGFEPPEYNADAVQEFIAGYQEFIDAVFAHGCNGIFFDEADVGYWDPNYGAAAAQVMREVGLKPLCDYVRAKGGQSIVNGATFFAREGEIFLLESFIGNWTGNPFRPSWNYFPFFYRYGQSLAETGELGGVNWTTGIRAYLYIWKYAHAGPHGTVMYGHSYGDPLSPWQFDRQLTCYAAFRATGIRSFNYINPDNQVLQEILVHRYYLGAPLETPTFDLENETISRRFSGGSVFYDDKDPAASQVNLDVAPDYWFNVGRAFDEVPWDQVLVQSGAALEGAGYIPPYLRITSAKMWDDRANVFIRVELEEDFPETDSIPIFLYLELDPDRPGWQTALQNDKVSVYMHFADIKAQVYLYGKSLFLYQGTGGTDHDFRFLYQVEGGKEGTVMHWRIRKETLRFCMPSWDGETIHWFPCYEGATGSGFFLDGSVVAQNDSPLLTVNGKLTNTLQNLITYVPHTAVIYSGPSTPNHKILHVSISGVWEKAWVFDRKTGSFIGPDGTPDSFFTSSPFVPPRTVDATDLYVLVAGNNASSPTAESFAVSGVSVDLFPWAVADPPGYDVPLPDLVAWQSVYDGWKDEKMPTSHEYTYTPLGIKRGTIKFKKDTLKDRFVVTVQGSEAITNLLDSTDIRGARVVLRRTFEDADFSDPDQTETLVVAYVDSWEFAEGELVIQAKTNLNNWQSHFPRRRVSYFCPYIFKDSSCTYGGPESFCDKTLPTCEGFGNEDKFGGFPTIPRLQRGKWG